MVNQTLLDNCIFYFENYRSKQFSYNCPPIIPRLTADAIVLPLSELKALFSGTWEGDLGILESGQRPQDK